MPGTVDSESEPLVGLDPGRQRVVPTRKPADTHEPTCISGPSSLTQREVSLRVIV